jgi:hypothetical protein
MRGAVNRPALRVERLEDRTTPITTALFAAGAGAGGSPLVNVYELDTATSVHKVKGFLAYEPAFRGGVNVATADLNGDGIDEIITGPGRGRAPTVNVIDGASLLKGQVVLLRSFNAYDPAFTGGVYVAGGSFSVSGPYQPAIITGAGAGGGPHVRVFDFNTLAVDRQFYAYDPHFRGGVRVARGITAGGLVTGAGPGGGPHVKVYNFDGSLNTQFYAFDPSFTGGVFVATSNEIGPAQPPHGFQVINLEATAGPGGPPEVRLYAVNTNAQTTTLQSTLTPYPNFRGGASVAVTADQQNHSAFLLTAPGPGGGPDVRVFDGTTFQPQFRFNAFDATFLGGVNLSGDF